MTDANKKKVFFRSQQCVAGAGRSVSSGRFDEPNDEREIAHFLASTAGPSKKTFIPAIGFHLR